MSRSIKFRVWDKHFQEMCDVSSMFFPFKKRNGFDIVEGHGVSGSPYRDITLTEANPLLPLTGKKDKNGTDVYDGDQIKVLYETDLDDVELTGVVEWSDEYSCFMVDFPTHGVRKALSAFDEVEVVGNIYQSPEPGEEDVAELPAEKKEPSVFEYINPALHLLHNGKPVLPGSAEHALLNDLWRKND